MVYLEKTGITEQLVFLKSLSGLRSDVVRLWLYPESKFRHFAGVELVSSVNLNYTAPTAYTHECQAQKLTKPCDFDASFIELLYRNRRILKSECSAITLHKGEQSDWDFCMYFGEGLSLIKSKDIEVFARGNMLKVLKNPPPWW